jgi:hypothetical protein
MRVGAPGWRECRLAVGAALLSLLAAPASAETFACAPLRPSTSQMPAYGPVAGQPRCEGFFDQTVAQSFVELVSLTRGAAQLEAATATLAITSPLATRLTIQPLAAAPFYRVDAPLRAAQPWTWDARPMLQATGLRPEDIGFLALATATSDDLARVAPVSMSSASQASAAGFATLRASVALSSLAWRVYDPGAQTTTPTWRQRDQSAYAWQPVAVALDLPDAARAVRVDVRARDAAGQALPMLSFIVLGTQP